MKKKIIQQVFRVLFSLLLLIVAYPETGFWTSLILTLVIINNEVQYWINDMLMDIIDQDKEK